MRKFYIENENGERRDLNNKGGVFFENPAGLGLVNEIEYAGIGQAFFDNVSEMATQDSIVGDIVFTKNSYEKYRDFVNWIFRAEKLLLIYSPCGTNEFYRRVELSYLTKTELITGKWLRAPISLACLTPWYAPSPLNLSLTKQSSNAMRYDFSYVPSLIYGSSTAGNMATDIEAMGHIPAAMVIKYTGIASNPAVVLTRANGEELGKCAITGTIAEGETLEVSTAYGDSYVIKKTATGVVDLLNEIDIAKNPFFKIPLYEPCTIRLTADDVMTGETEAQMFVYYRSV